MARCTLCRKRCEKGSLSLSHWPAGWNLRGKPTRDRVKRYGDICRDCAKAVDRAWEERGM